MSLLYEQGAFPITRMRDNSNIAKVIRLAVEPELSITKTGDGIPAITCQTKKSQHTLDNKYCNAPVVLMCR